MNKKTDRRVKRTKTRLKEVLVELLQIKELQKIRVNELCERADINRSTFYLHYNNVFDLWKNIEDDIISGFNDILYTFKAKEILTKPLPMLFEVTTFLEKEHILNRELFRCRESVVLLEKIKGCFIDYFTENTREIINSESGIEMQIYADFVISGSVTLFYRWFLGELNISLKELAVSIEKLITGGVEDYLSGLMIS